jgi:hypothetical protein
VKPAAEKPAEKAVAVPAEDRNSPPPAKPVTPPPSQPALPVSPAAPSAPAKVTPPANPAPGPSLDQPRPQPLPAQPPQPAAVASAGTSASPANPLRGDDNAPTGDPAARAATGDEPRPLPEPAAELKPLPPVTPRKLVPIPETPKPSAELTIRPAVEEKKTPPAAVKPAPESKPPAAKRRRPSNRNEPPFDPIAANGPIFVGWPKPKLALLITGRQEGYLEPCGCAGLDRMKGGMSRRDTLFKTLRNGKGYGWPVVGLDVGDIVKGFGHQAEIKLQNAVEGMQKMGYDGITLGSTDLQLPAGLLASVMAGTPDHSSPFISANVGLFGFNAKVLEPYRIVVAGGLKIGITGVLGKTFQRRIHSDEVEMSDPEVALRQIVPEMKKKADYLVLLANATMKESTDLAKAFPEFAVVVTAGGPPEQPRQATRLNDGKTLLVEVGEKGANAVVLGLYDDGTVRDQRVPLDSRFAASSAMKQQMAAYQGQLKQIGLAGLGVLPAPDPLRASNGRYVGSKACEKCHEESCKVWRRSAHAEAYDTLAKLDPPRNHDPECISCHVVGWNPGKFFPYEGGFQSDEKTPHLEGVGCEDCHGPGKKHCDAEQGKNEDLQKKYQKAVRNLKEDMSDPRSGRQNCYNCHDGDNSPQFDFKDYYPLIEHKE